MAAVPPTQSWSACTAAVLKPTLPDAGLNVMPISHDCPAAKVTDAAQRLIRSLSTSAPPKNREEEARKAKERSRERFA